MSYFKNSQVKEIGRALEALSQDHSLLFQVYATNPWFTPQLVCTAIESMRFWWDQIDTGQIQKEQNQRTIGIIMAGNVPLVGLHDLLSVWKSGHHARIKLSGKDSLLIPALLEKLAGELPVTIVDRLDPSKIDFLLATGSDNTARYLAHDFADLPRLIRKNRFSVAVLSGDETAEDWNGLARDILLYHGMGCRSVSNLFVPAGVDLSPLWNAIDRFPPELLSEAWNEIVQWEQAIYAINGHEKSPTTRLLPQKQESPGSAKIGVLHLIDYSSSSELESHLAAAKDKIQCIVGQGQAVPFGHSQLPGWDDYADGVNVMELLGELG